ncbi:MAG TPA: MlaD family protein [Bacteroidales bacterium]|nr:MlaD family protein [Bacteroidales bacterium]
MEESHNRNSVVVGLFITIGIAIFVAAVVLIGDMNRSLHKRIRIVSYFQDVSGLQRGNFIWLNGVRIGTVKSVRLESDKVAVLMDIDAGVTSNIYKDSKVKLGTDGLIGNRILLISGGSPGSGNINPGDSLSAEEALSMDDLMGTLQSSNSNLLEITENLKILSGKLTGGEGNISMLLNDNSIYSNMDQAVNSLRNASATADRLLKSIAGYTERLNRKGTLAFELASDTVIFSSVRESAEKLNHIADTAALFITDLRNSGKNQNTAVGALISDEKAGRDIAKTLENLKTSSELLNQDLEALQHSFPLKRYFKKKNKASENE